MFLRSLADLRKQKTFKGLESHARAIFFIALNSNLTHRNSTDKAGTLLTTSILVLPVDDEYDFEDDNDMDSDDDSENDLKFTNIFKWADNLYKQCQEEIDIESATDDINGFYCPPAAKKLKTLLPYFPMFSDVMPALFSYGSERPISAAVESEFNDLKNRVLKDVANPMRVDKFISRHIPTFSGKLKIAMASTQQKNFANDPQESPPTPEDPLFVPEDPLSNFNNSSASHSESMPEKQIFEEEDRKKFDRIQSPVIVKNTTKAAKSSVPKKRKRSSSDQFVELRELRAEQNWRNKNLNTRQRRYEDPFPQFDPTLKYATKLPIIVNANLCKNVSNNDTTFVISNTCGFDSICQILAQSMKNNELYKKKKQMMLVTLFMNVLVYC